MSRHDPRSLDAGTGLASLPSQRPDRDAWPEIARRVAQDRAHRHRPARWLTAVAAGLALLAFGLIAQLSHRVDAQERQLEAWVQYSQELELRLVALRSVDQPVRGHRAAVMGELEDRIAAVDLALAGAPQAQEADVRLDLWRQRTVLLNDLVTVETVARLRPDDQSPQPVITLNPSASAAARPVIHEL